MADDAEFAQFLQSLHQGYRPSETGRLGVSALDRLLHLFASPLPLQREATAQWTLQHPPPTTIRQTRLPVLEVTSLEPCSGRTQLLYYVVAHSVLPNYFQDTKLPGREGAVVYFDTDFRFSSPRLSSILAQVLGTAIGKSDHPAQVSTEDVESTVLSSLDHVHVFSPASSSALLSILSNLPTYLLNTHLHKSSARPLATLIISNIGAFVWSDRHAPASTSSSSSSTEPPSPAVLIQRFAELTARLRAISKQFSCTIVAGSWAFSSPRATAHGGKELRSHLPQSWNDLCAVRVVVQREKVRKFGPGLSVEEAVLDRPKRLEAVQKAGWSGWVNCWGWEGWEKRMLDRLRGMKDGGAFEMRIDGAGVQLWEAGVGDG